MSFSIKFLEALQPKAKPYRELEGSSRPGFGVQVSTGGKITFIYLYRTPEEGKQRVMSLGSYYGVDREGKAKNGGLSLKEAYAAYADARRTRETGRDPQQVRADGLAQEATERQAAEERAKQAAMQGSIRQLFDAYTDDLRAANKRSWAEVNRALAANVYPVLPESTKAKSVEPQAIRAVLAEMMERGAMIAANRVRAYLSAAFAFGMQWDNDPKRHFETLRFGITANPVRDVPKPEKSEKPRDRALSEAEIKQLWESLDYAIFHPKTVAVIRLLFALGGQRVEEVLGINAKDVDMQSRIITLRNTKNGSTHVVPFGDIAASILQERLNQTCANDGALFGAIRGNAGALIEHTTISHAIKKLCPRIEIEAFQPKDIRRTVKTLMGFCGIRKEDRDRFQNHALTDVSSRHYDRYDYLAEKRQVMAVWDAYLTSILAGAPKTNVIPLRVGA